MSTLGEKTLSGLGLVVVHNGDPTLWVLSLRVTVFATFCAALVGIPSGALVALSRLRGRTH